MSGFPVPLYLLPIERSGCHRTMGLVPPKVREFPISAAPGRGELPYFATSERFEKRFETRFENLAQLHVSPG
jgi:hypothetical protein